MVLQRDVVLSFLLKVRSARLANVLLILTSALQIILLVTGIENVHVPLLHHSSLSCLTQCAGMCICTYMYIAIARVSV